MALFVDTLTVKTAPQHPTWRHMQWNVLALMLSMQLQTIPSLVVTREASLPPSLVLANTQLQYPIALSLRRKVDKIIILLTCFSRFPSLTRHNFESAQIARWCAESNRPLKIIKDRAFAVLMKAGRPGTTIPSPMTVSWDIDTAFERCRECIDQILKVCLHLRVSFNNLSPTTGTSGSCTLWYWYVDFSKPQSFRCLDHASSPWGTCAMFPSRYCWSSWGLLPTVAYSSIIL